MKAPYHWLKSLVEIKSTAQDLSQKLSLISIGVDKVDQVDNQPVLDIDVTYNRGDLMSMVGLAYEVAFIENSRLNLPKIKIKLKDVPGLDDWQITRQPQNCPLYVAVLLELKPQPTPGLIQQRLRQAGVAVKNNIVDLANYVMWQYGQPFHTFDADKLPSQNLAIKPAGKSLAFKTLDGKTRLLDANDILIWAGDQPVALAGIIGGLDTEITPETSQVLLETALFDPYQIRRTAMRLGLFSDAANRFIHKPSSQTSLQALAYLLDLYRQHAKAKIIGIKISGQAKKTDSPSIKVTTAEFKRLIGLKLGSDKMASILTGFHFSVKSKNGEIEAVPPHWRQDIHLKEDVIEEIIRGWGYFKLKSEPLPLGFINQKETYDYHQETQIKNFLTGQGLYQVNTYGFYSQAQLEYFKIETDNLIEVTNPISAEAKYMKSSLLAGDWQYLKDNLNKNLPLDKPIGIFEMNRSYQAINRKPSEVQRLAIMTPSQADLNRIVNNLLEYARLDYSSLNLSQNDKVLADYKANVSHRYRLSYKAKPLADLALVSRFWAVEFDYVFLSQAIKLKPHPPATTRFTPIIEDLTFELPAGLEPFRLLIRLKQADKRIAQINLVNLYQNRLTVKLAYLSPDRQLTSRQAEIIRKKVVAAATKFNCRLIGQI